MFKIENQLYYREEFCGVYKILHVQRSNGVPVRASCFTRISFSHPKVSATGPKFSVLCHVATGSLVSHHGLRKYWHLFLMKLSSPYAYKQKGKKKRGREQKLCFKDNRLKAKEYGALISSKKNICPLICMHSKQFYK